MNIQRRTLVAADDRCRPAVVASLRKARSFSASPRSAPRANGAPPTPNRSSPPAKDAGIDLKFSDAQQKQENQIKAIRSFIAQKVDVIAFSPVVESGWGTVLREAKAAKIPVILSDRAVDEKDDSLWVSFMGSDFVEEGRQAPGAGWSRTRRARRATVNIVELQGTVGSAPAIDRKKGFEEIIKADPKLQDHPLADRRLHARQGQGSDGGLPQGRGQEDQRALRAQRRHGDRRDPGDRGSRHEAGARTSPSSRSTR